MAFSMAGGRAPGPQILIDVLLTLIIMFMLVVSMDPEHGERAQIPQPNPDHPVEDRLEPRTIVLQVVWTTKDEVPLIKLNEEDVRWEDLERPLGANLSDPGRESSLRARRR